MTAETAFGDYEAARHRLPPAAGPGPSRRVATLDDIAADFDVFLLDAFGVLNIGETAIPEVPERVRGLQAAGKRVLVLTNAASLPLSALMRKYARLGYEFDPADVISSRVTALRALRADTDRHWGLMASEPPGSEDLDGLRLSLLGDDPAPYAEVDAFLLLGSGDWTEARQALLEAALADRSRPVWVGNPDVVAPRQSGFSIEPGHYAHRLADRIGIAPRFFGKPFRNIYDLAFERIGPGIDPARVLMVGDSLHTDVLGAQAAGVASALIAQWGFFATQDVAEAIDRAGIHPDFILDRP